MRSLVLLGIVGLVAGGANAGVIYQQRLVDHPDGNQNPPPYGLRIDNIFRSTDSGATLLGSDGNGATTFSFSHAQSNVFIQIIDDIGNDGIADRIRIFGTAYGGMDQSNQVGVGAGEYEIEMNYFANVTTVAGPDGGWRASASSSNVGTITAKTGIFAGAGSLGSRSWSGPQSWGFSDKNDAGFSFNFLRNKHRLTTAQANAFGGDPYVAEGWVMLDNNVGGTQDWLAVAIPLPTTTGMALAGMGVLALRRRRA